MSGPHRQVGGVDPLRGRPRCDCDQLGRCRLRLQLVQPARHRLRVQQGRPAVARLERLRLDGPHRRDAVEPRHPGQLAVRGQGRAGRPGDNLVPRPLERDELRDPQHLLRRGGDHIRRHAVHGLGPGDDPVRGPQRARPARDRLPAHAERGEAGPDGHGAAGDPPDPGAGHQPAVARQPEQRDRRQPSQLVDPVRIRPARRGRGHPDDPPGEDPAHGRPDLAALVPVRGPGEAAVPYGGGVARPQSLPFGRRRLLHPGVRARGRPRGQRLPHGRDERRDPSEEWGAWEHRPVEGPALLLRARSGADAPARRSGAVHAHDPTAREGRERAARGGPQDRRAPSRSSAAGRLSEVRRRRDGRRAQLRGPDRAARARPRVRDLRRRRARAASERQRAEGLPGAQPARPRDRPAQPRELQRARLPGPRASRRARSAGRHRGGRPERRRAARDRRELAERERVRVGLERQAPPALPAAHPEAVLDASGAHPTRAQPAHEAARSRQPAGAGARAARGRQAHGHHHRRLRRVRVRVAPGREGGAGLAGGGQAPAGRLRARRGGPEELRARRQAHVPGGSGGRPAHRAAPGVRAELRVQRGKHFHREPRAVADRGAAVRVRRGQDLDVRDLVKRKPAHRRPVPAELARRRQDRGLLLRPVDRLRGRELEPGRDQRLRRLGQAPGHHRRRDRAGGRLPGRRVARAHPRRLVQELGLLGQPAVPPERRHPHDHAHGSGGPG